MPDQQTPAHRSIAAEIRANGPITFARFMEIALYGEHGYYSSLTTPGTDYATSPQMHPAFGALIGGYLFKAWQALAEPNPYHVVELGAGDGILAEDILETTSTDRSHPQSFQRRPESSMHASARNDDELDRFKHALIYHPLDIRPRGSAHPIDDLPEPTPINGCIISNELLDAFPTHIFTIRNREVLELYVDTDQDNSLHFIEDQTSAHELSDRISCLTPSLPDGYRGEANLRIQSWANEVRSLLQSGYVLTIDYGHPRETLYHPDRHEGSLRCYQSHVLGQNPFRDIGQQDITAHVDFTEIDNALTLAGFQQMAPLQTQRDFLYDLGIGQYSQHLRRSTAASSHEHYSRRWTPELRALNSLTDTRGLGNFRVAQHVINAPNFDLLGLETAPIFPLTTLKPHHLEHLPYD